MNTIVDQAIHRRQSRNPQSAGSRRPNAGRAIGTFGPRHSQDAFVLSRKGGDETERVSWVRSLADGATPWHLVWISTTSSDRPGGSSTCVAPETHARHGGSGPTRGRRASR